MKFTAEMIAAALGGEIVGDRNAEVWTMAKIEEGCPGAISFLSNPKYEHYIYSCRSSIIIVNKTFTPAEPVSATLIKVEDAYAAFAALLDIYVANKPQKSGIHPTAVIDSSATIGENVYIGAYAVIEVGVVVGDGARIYPHVYVGDYARIGTNTTLNSGVKVYEQCVVGDNVIVHAGAVIGADGFGFAPKEDGSYEKIPQIGNVVIENNVEIGANTCIDRSTMGSTRVKQGVKLDNLIQVAHNVVIDENTVIAAQVGIAGSTKIGRHCMIGGQAGIVGHINIGDRVNIASQTGVTNSIADNQTVMSFYAIPAPLARRCAVIYRNLPDLRDKVLRLEKDMAKLAADKGE